eukprot:6462686-Amphidinium_carterae.2
MEPMEVRDPQLLEGQTGGGSHRGGTEKESRGRILSDGVVEDMDTRRRMRERENANAIGGLRDSWRAACRVPGWLDVGPRVREVILEEMGDSHDELVDLLGTASARSPCTDLVARVRVRLARLLSVNPQGHTGLQGWLIQALTAAAKDPDVEISKWVLGAAPLGASRSIEPCGIFPQIPERDGDDSEGPCIQEQVSGSTGSEFANYVSYYQNQELADIEFQREVKAGYATVYQSRAAAERIVGTLVPSRVAAVVKNKSGRVKTRLVHDLRRSGVNATLKVPERVVLPRLADVLEATLDLQGRATPNEE